MLDVAILATVLRSSNGKDTRFKTSTRVSLEGDLKNLLLSPEHANLFLHALALSIVSESGIFGCRGLARHARFSLLFC